MSAEEWQARVDLAACYRLVDKYGMTDLIYNHITARIPGSKDHLLINLYGMLYKEITASSLVKIDVAMAARTELVMPGENVLAHTAHLYQPGTRRPYGVLEWPAMLRVFEAEDRHSGYPPYWH